MSSMQHPSEVASSGEGNTVYGGTGPDEELVGPDAGSVPGLNNGQPVGDWPEKPVVADGGTGSVFLQPPPAGEVDGEHDWLDRPADPWTLNRLLPLSTEEIAVCLEGIPTSTRIEIVRDLQELRQAVGTGERVQAYMDDMRARREAKRLLDAEESGGSLSSWEPVDLSELLDEEAEPEEPDVGRFVESATSNGGGVFYSGKVNEIHGPSESGKSMLALHVAAQEIRAGRRALMIDYEDDGRSVVTRLRTVLGLTAQQVRDGFVYIQPSGAATDEAITRVVAQVVQSGAVLVIIDAVTEAMTAEGLDGRNENDVAAWQKGLPKKVAAAGPAVVVIDHTSKAGEMLGSQHKKSGVTGVSYRCEPLAPFVRDGKGKLRLRVEKDRPGSVRAMALPGGENQKHWRGDLVIDGVGRPGSPEVSLYGVDQMKVLEARKEGAAGPSPDETLAEHAEAVAEFVRENPGASKDTVKEHLGKMRAQTKTAAIDEAERLGLIRVDVKPGKTHKCFPLEPAQEGENEAA